MLIPGGISGKKLLACLLGFFGFVASVHSVLAVDLKPLRTELVIDPGSEATAQLLVVNSGDQEITVEPEVRSYVENDQSGFPIATDLESADPLNITDWVVFAEPTLTLRPAESRRADFIVKVPENAEPGERKASIVYNSTSGVGNEENSPARVASLILVEVTGEKTYGGEVSAFGIKDGAIYSDTGVGLEIVFQNTGNVSVVPEGRVVITNADGDQIHQVAHYRDESGAEIESDTIPVNLAGVKVLPGSAGSLQAFWTDNLSTGNFQAELDLDYGGEKPIRQTADFEIREEVSLTDFTAVRNSRGVDFSFTAVNSGNIYERLAGGVEVKDGFGKVVASPTIGVEVGYLSPGESRTVTIPWVEELPGRGEYSAKFQIAYGLAGNSLEEEVTFGEAWLNVPLLILIVSAGLALAVVWVVFFKRRASSAENLEKAAAETLRRESIAEAQKSKTEKIIH